MDTKVNYTLVGVFVFSFGLLLVGFLLWMAKFGFEEKKYDQYTILVQESVSGLNVESPVKFRGVEVGNVTTIKIDPQNSEVILVDIDVEPNTPIKQDSVAVLTAQGITGLSYIELKGGSKKSPRLPAGGTIKAGKSLFDKIEYSATSVTEGLVHTLTRVDALLSDNNIHSVELLLVNLSELSQTLNNTIKTSVPLVINQENAESIKQTLANTAKASQALADTIQSQLPQILNQENSDNIRITLASAAQAGRNLEQQSRNIGNVMQTTVELENTAIQTLNDYSGLSKNMQELLKSIQQRIDSGEFDLRQMTEHHLEALNALLVELQMLSNQTNEVLQQLKRSPSDLLFKQEVLKPGPGE